MTKAQIAQNVKRFERFVKQENSKLERTQKKVDEIKATIKMFEEEIARLKNEGQL